MKNKFMNYFYWFTAVFPFILSAAFYSQLPEQMATHWDMAGNPNNFASRPVAAFGLPVILLLLILLVNFRIYADPKRQNINRSPQMKLVSRWLVVILVNVTHFASILKNMNANINITQIIFLFLALSIAVIGNYLPKLKYNYTVGIKLPWTLASEENWRKTHRFAGFVWIICGILLAVTSFFPYKWLNFSILIVLAAVPAIYSYLLFVKEKGAADRSK
jgi:uncharacterized membrane protein